MSDDKPIAELIDVLTVQAMLPYLAFNGWLANFVLRYAMPFIAIPFITHDA